VSVDGAEFSIGATDAAVGVGDSVTFCVRPEALSVDGSANRFSVDVETAEFLGETTRYYADWEGRTVVFRTPDSHDGRQLTLGFDPADARLL